MEIGLFIYLLDHFIRTEGGAGDIDLQVVGTKDIADILPKVLPQASLLNNTRSAWNYLHYLIVVLLFF